MTSTPDMFSTVAYVASRSLSKTPAEISKQKNVTWWCVAQYIPTPSNTSKFEVFEIDAYSKTL